MTNGYEEAKLYIRARTGQKLLWMNTQIHDIAERMKMRRAVIARQDGLIDPDAELPEEGEALEQDGEDMANPYDVGTYPARPSHTTTTTTHHHTGNGMLKGALLSAALLGGGSLATLGGLNALGVLGGSDESPPPAVTEPVDDTDVDDRLWRLDIDSNGVVP